MDPNAASHDHAEVRVLPPLLYLGSILLGVALNSRRPLRLHRRRTLSRRSLASCSCSPASR